MVSKPTYEELEQKLYELENIALQRKRTEQTLRESEELFRNVYNTAPLAFVVWDLDTRVTDWNKKAEEVFGWPREEALGRNFFDFLIPENDRPHVEHVVDMLIKGELPSCSINDNLTKNGQIITCEWNNSSLHDDNGNVVGAISLALDITARKEAEEALRKSEKKYSILVENSLTGIYLDQDKKIVFANRRFAEIFKYQRKETLGLDVWELVHPEDRALTNMLRERRLKGQGAPEEYEARGLTKDGETIWIIRRNVCIEYQGRPAILGNVVDITELKHAEQKVEKINKELKSFVDVVSHDLKTPIVSIQGFSSRLLKHFQEKLGEKGRKYLEQINASAHRMEVLVSDLLELSRIGQAVPSFKDTPSIGIVKGITSALEDRLKESKIKLTVANNLPTIYCDEERMFQVFENLLVNAIKFTSYTNNPKIEIGYEDRGGFHQFYVRDNGIGIDPKHHQSIFEIFHRLKQIQDEEGTGLGLTIVNKIIYNHGGKVWVESEKGKGATFNFTLPKAPSSVRHLGLVTQ
ncbi:MAG: PAS domain S-box protein [Deltaproteobacteria bacterium]|nr:PAS domain S-box protein [Deltaproteobacteria bacterium]